MIEPENLECWKLEGPASLALLFFSRRRLQAGLLLVVCLTILVGCGDSISTILDADELVRKGKHEQACEMYLKVIKADQTSPIYRLPFLVSPGIRAARRLMKSKQMLAEERELDEQVAILSSIVDDLLLVANRYPWEKKYRRRVALYLLRISWFRLENNDFDGAQEQIRSAAELYPDLPEGIYCLGLLAWLRGDTVQAETIMRQVLRVEPGFIRARQALVGLAAPED